MNPIGAILTLVSIGLVLLGSRRFALWGLLIVVLFATQGQHVLWFGFNVFALRLVEVSALVRVIVRGELRETRFNAMDKVFLLFQVARVTMYYLQGSEGLSYQMGVLVDGCCCYYPCRALLRDAEGFRQLVRDLPFLLGPYVVCILYEMAAGQSVFVSMGGLPEEAWTRSGRYRCTGSFRHPVLSGSVGVTFLPIFLGLAFSPETRKRALVGIVLCLGIIVSANSGGVQMTAMAAAGAWFCWQWRTRMRAIRWGLVISLVTLHMIMKAPVWYLMARVSDVVGGDGWHRANLLDKFIGSFSEWWLVGMPITKTQDWAATNMAWGGIDVTNGFANIGLNGGLLPLVLFIVVLVRGYQAVGASLRAVRAGEQDSTRLEPFIWGLGVALTAHLVNLMGIAYWDQFNAIWCLHLAAISGLYVTAAEAPAVIEPEPEVSDEEAWTRSARV